MNTSKKLQYIVTDLKIALKKAELAENSADCVISYAILKGAVIAKIEDLEFLEIEYE